MVVSEVTEGGNGKVKTLRKVLDNVTNTLGGGIILRAVSGGFEEGKGTEEKGTEGKGKEWGKEGGKTKIGLSPSFGALSSTGSFNGMTNIGNSPGRASHGSPRLFALSSSMERSPGGAGFAWSPSRFGTRRPGR